MRILAPIPLALLIAGCWTPGPGQIDPSRYPWDPVNVRARTEAEQAQRPQGRYCVVALEPAASGITFAGGAKAPDCPPRADEADSSEEDIWIMCGPPPESDKRAKAAARRSKSCARSR